MKQLGGRAAEHQFTSTSGFSGVAELRAELARKIAGHIRGMAKWTTSIPRLALYRKTAPTPCNAVTYEPSLAVFAQGKKRVTLGGVTYLCDETTFLLTSIDVPVVSQIVSANEQAPFLSLLLKLDMAMVREILSTEEFQTRNGSSQAHGIAIGRTTVELLRPCSRLLDLIDTPEDIPFLSSLIQREIVYRLLRGPQGSRLRAIATLGDQSHRTAKAIAWLRANYTKPLHLEDLAEVAGMGMSTLHHHFRALTAMSPLQYQKQLRLVAARERMLIEGLDASSAAFEVGYESPSQFNREYKRFFGEPPMRDIKSRQVAELTAVHNSNRLVHSDNRSSSSPSDRLEGPLRDSG
jgi:AraC-like DNA-binding protein